MSPVDEAPEGRLRVLVAHNRYRSGQPSGEDAVVDREIALLREHRHRVAVFERCSDEIAAMSARDKALAFARMPWSGPSARQFADALAEFRPDVVHVHNSFPLISPSILDVAAQHGVPVVATLHHYRQICPSGEMFRADRPCDDCVGRLPLPAIRHGCYRGSRAATLPLVVTGLVGRRAWWGQVALFFCISAAQRHTLIAGGMPADRLTVKPNFVPDLGSRSGPGEHVLYLGRLAENKGIRVLVEAWERFAAANPGGPPLVVAGDGPLRATVQEWAAARRNVRFAGLLERDQCTELTRTATALVAPSTWQEPFGLTVVEAMSMGVPVLASAHGAFPELVADGRTGLLHTPGDAADLARHLAEIHAGDASVRLGRAARCRYEAGFSPATGLTNLVEGYRSAIAAGPRRARGPVVR